MKLINKSIYSTLLALMLSSSAIADCSYELFSISSTKGTKIIDFIDQLSDECEFSIIITDPYAEKFLETTLNKTHLNNLTIDEVLSIILNENNLSYTLENNLLRISYLTTKIFSIDYILSHRKGSGSTDITLSSETDIQSNSQGRATTGATGASGGKSSANSGANIETSDEVKFWEELDLEFQTIINRPQDTYQAPKPVINKNAGLVTVTATTKQMQRFENYLKKLQSKVQLQVLIDVQLLSVTMSNAKTTGIDWEQLYALQSIELAVNHISNNNAKTWESGDKSINISTMAESGVDAFDSVANIVSVKAGGSLNEVIKFLQTQGDVNAISNPKVLTLNNQPALITAGTEYFYKLTSTETLASGTSGTQGTDENIKSVFAGVLLSITPQIGQNDTITLIVNPSLSETRSDISADNSNRVMPPDLVRRQLSSVVTVKDGNRVVLGGLINTKNTNKSNKVPLLGDIPIISYLFKYEEMVKVTEELVIIIEPHIIHRERDSVSLSDLGYEGLVNGVLTNERSVSMSDGVDKLAEINRPKVDSKAIEISK